MSQQQVLPATPESTALLDALIARGLRQADPQALASAQPLAPGSNLPNPDPNSSPPLYGEPPGEGYLYPHDPATRQAAMVTTDPQYVRAMLLRAIEVMAITATLPFNEEGPQKLADAALKMSQAYLLLDPTVDAQGVSVAGQATAQAGAQIAVQAGKPQEAPKPLPAGGESGAAHGTVKRSPPTGGHGEPPRVAAGRAAEILQEMHANAEAVLHGARGSRPLPRPRPGS